MQKVEQVEKTAQKHRTFDMFSDPGHGWLRVPKKLLMVLGIADKITGYSYMKGEYAYLEEDSDLTEFVRVMETKGIEVKYEDHITNAQSKIRNYEPYRA